jgi:soluble lytic murein transglycosylase-like protein
LNSQAMHGLTADPWTYLRSNRELPSLPPSASNSPAAPTSGVFSSRVECIIAKESGGANIANRRGSGAVGVAQYMPSTFAAHATEMGHPEWSPWSPDQARAVAAHDLALGRRAQWSVGGC